MKLDRHRVAVGVALALLLGALACDPKPGLTGGRMGASGEELDRGLDRMADLTKTMTAAEACADMGTTCAQSKDLCDAYGALCSSSESDEICSLIVSACESREGNASCESLASRCTEDQPPSGTPPPANNDAGPPQSTDVCTASGVATACDPAAPSGCSEGACYLLPAVGGPACMCPPGGVGVGESCNSTAACAPGLVCAGTTAPGTCRTICRTAATDACATGETCVQINQFAEYGYCEPQ